MSDINSNNPLGQDSIKGGIFFGSNLTPGGTFSNVPQTTASQPPFIAVEAKVVLTLQQIKEELQKTASSELGVHTDILSPASINAFLQSYVQLLIDYSDMRNYVFFGSAYTELSYQVNFLTKNYPYKAYFAKDVDLGLITITPITGGSIVSFVYSEVLQPANYSFNNSGETIWVNYDLVDKNNTRFPITNITFTGTGPTMTIDITVEGTMSVNNFIEFNPVVSTTYKGFVISPKLEVLKEFDVTISPMQRELLNEGNPSPWPRDFITNNIQTSGSDYDNWIADPSNMVSGYNVDELGYVTNTEVGLSLTSGMTLDDTVTNQLIRKAVPHRLVDELRDTDDKYFTRFILLAGKMFDTIKVYIDFLKYTKELNYTPFNQLSPDFYRVYAEHFGFDLFDDENIDLAKAIIKTEPGLSYNNLDQPVYNDETSQKTLQELQNEKQKRLLINLFYLYSTKGTIKCIEVLAKLLGAPNGLVVFEEKVFNTVTGNRETDNSKIKVPQIAYEIDPDYLTDKNNINNPVNFPYVYRLKLDNDSIINLRELDGFTDPQGAIQSQVINYGTNTYCYGHFSHRSFANLQNNATTNPLGYYLLPLTFPDKYCGITVEYMLPRNAYTKGVGKNVDETSIHIGSLFEVADITYTDPLNPTKPDLLSNGQKYAYVIPQVFMTGIASNTESLTIPYSASFTISTLSGGVGDTLEVYVGGSPIGGTTWQSTKKATVLALVNSINFLSDNEYVAYYKENAGASYTITIESKKAFTPSILPGLLMEVLTNAVVDGAISGSSQVMSDGKGIQERSYIIARIEGKDLVVRARLQGEGSWVLNKRIALFENLFNADGLNHELRLIYRPEGVEVYQDFKYLGLARWRDPAPYTDITCPKTEINNLPIVKLGDLFAYPDNENGTNPGNDTPSWWDLFIGNPVGINMFFKRVAVQELQAINTGDTIDFGSNLLGQEVEKYSFNFVNQEKDLITGNYLTDKISVVCEYRAPSPTIGLDDIDDYLTAYANEFVTDIRLINQTYLRNSEARFIQDIQNFFNLPTGQTITIDSLFQFNGWSPTIHEDYTYKNFNEVYNNYQIFSEQVLTYLSLLSFMELVENRFKKLVSQFIPIVINLSRFGRLVRQLEKQKIHYPNLYHTCGGNIIGTPSRASFRIVHGSNSEYADLTNVLTVGVKIVKFISDASNTSPIVITTSVPHNFQDATAKVIAGVRGNTAANGTHTITVLTPYTFELDLTVGNGAYTGGGTATDIIQVFSTIYWHGSNVLTAIDVANDITTTGYPFSATNVLNTVVIDVDMAGWVGTSYHNINDCELYVVTSSNVQVDSLSGFGGGYESITTGGCFTVTVTNNIPVAEGFTEQFIYYDAEQSLNTYIYLQSEVFIPEPYYYIN